MDLTITQADFDTKFSYIFRIDYEALRSKVRHGRLYVYCYKKLLDTELYVGRLELNPTTKEWQLGISLGSQFHPSKQTVTNLVKWANQHISRKRNVLLRKVINDNNSTVA